MRVIKPCPGCNTKLQLEFKDPAILSKRILCPECKKVQIISLDSNNNTASKLLTKKWKLELTNSFESGGFTGITSQNNYSLEITNQTTAFGRATDAPVKLPKPNAVLVRLKDTRSLMSKLHFILETNEDDIVITDMKSANGTSVNRGNTNIQLKANEPYPAQDNDIITAGLFEFKLTSN